MPTYSTYKSTKIVPGNNNAPSYNDGLIHRIFLAIRNSITANKKASQQAGYRKSNLIVNKPGFYTMMKDPLEGIRKNSLNKINTAKSNSSIIPVKNSNLNTKRNLSLQDSTGLVLKISPEINVTSIKKPTKPLIKKLLVQTIKVNPKDIAMPEISIAPTAVEIPTVEIAPAQMFDIALAVLNKVGRNALREAVNSGAESYIDPNTGEEVSLENLDPSILDVNDNGVIGRRDLVKLHNLYK